MMRSAKKVANSYNCESLDIANPTFLSLKNRGLANPSKVANREYCESLRAHCNLDRKKLILQERTTYKVSVF